MRIVVTGVTGNVGTSVLPVLGSDPTVDSVLGLARRLPERSWPKADFAAVDLADPDADLVGCLRGADAVIHLAWAIQPAREEEAMWRTNVEGTAALLRASADAGVGAVVVASSVGAYSTGPKDRSVDESWPTHGVPTSAYSRHKAYVERMLDSFEAEHPEIRLVRMRPGLLLKGDAASEVLRLFLGPFVPPIVLGRRLLPVFPNSTRLRFQVAHSLDAGEAFARAAVRPVRGAFNLAAEPVLDGAALAEILHARPVPVPPSLLRTAASVAWRMHLQPTDPGWVDLVLRVPIMDTSRVRRELEWEPRCDAADAVNEILDGFRERAGSETAPLTPVA
ncbi:MAG TPA: NAD-dependent epimerase/dehydratase family protein [Acidimicrobiia bacterium]|nr:NAD-dependent epimerase/dehydratase family protein [Acidimicrobiia bacterium]